MDYSQKKLGEQIKKYREMNNFSQALLAKRCNLSQSYIADIENGKGEYVGMINVGNIADALNVTIDDLLCDSLFVYQHEGEESTIKRNILDITDHLKVFSINELKRFYKLVNIYNKYKGKL